MASDAFLVEHRASPFSSSNLITTIYSHYISQINNKHITAAAVNYCYFYWYYYHHHYYYYLTTAY